MKASAEVYSDYTPPWWEQLPSRVELAPDPQKNFTDYVTFRIEQQLAREATDEEVFVIPVGKHKDRAKMPEAIDRMCERWGPDDKEGADGKYELWTGGVSKGRLVARVSVAEQRIEVPVQRGDPVRTANNVRTMVHALETVLWAA